MSEISPVPPWHQLPEEKGRPFMAFRQYLDLGNSRTHKAVAEVMSLSVRTVENYSSKFDWVQRAAAYDQHQEDRRAQIEEEELRRVLASKAEMWAQRREDVRERIYRLSEMLFSRGLNMLKYPLEKTVTTDEGRTVIVKPARWSGTTIVHTLRLASDMASLATGLAPGTHALDELNFDELGTEDLEAILKDRPIKEKQRR